ncbi:PDZ domain-containing protein 2 [Plakobranchus ocellatus]|uniref:PDZ domain-containing protein 2 n=1 Tax=Plakobranchus ocellatus TaxID=259542 RepID=A0AAV3YKQ2_9GAST|nr:PDZ domain-containing protein 2 [Plakobranchus ocellatus]
MDSEGSDLDELADLDLATFAARDSDISAQLKPTDSDSDDHQLTETDDNSLGDSMDSRASSDVMRVSEISDAAKEIVQGVVKPQSLASEHGTCLDREIQEEDFSANTNTSFSSVGTGAEAEQTADTNVLQDSGFDGSLLVSDRAGLSQHYVSLERLPGENLGMVLAIEGDQDNQRPVEAVLVRSVTPGGAASRAGGGGTSIQVGDEVREVDGQPLTELTHDQCITLFQDMPDNVVLTIHRASRQEHQSPGQSVSGQHEPGAAVSPAPPVPRPRGSVSRAGMLNMEEMVVGADNSTPRLDEDDGFVRTPRGFVKLDLTVFRGEGDSLGLSIVPSHGATCDLYQVSHSYFTAFLLTSSAIT